MSTDRRRLTPAQERLLERARARPVPVTWRNGNTVKALVRRGLGYIVDHVDEGSWTVWGRHFVAGIPDLGFECPSCGSDPDVDCICKGQNR